MTLVRKEVPWEDSENERVTLKFLALCGRPNLIKLLFYYKYGDALNLVFKRYKCSLEDILKGERPDLEEAIETTRYEGSMLRHWLWQGMINVVAALTFFHDPDYHNHSPEGQIIAAHFDLKPANILVDDNRDLVVTDFGEAQLRSMQWGQSTYITRGGGTTAYRPPDPLPVGPRGHAVNTVNGEEASQNRHWSRAYDIWSIACVMMEVIEYIRSGPEGFKNFRDSRVNDDHGSPTTSASFWRENSMERGPELKQSVREKLKSFRAQANNQADRYLNSVTGLLVRMFDMTAQTRPNMAECLSVLSQNFLSVDWPLLDDNEVPVCGLGTRKPLRSM